MLTVFNILEDRLLGFCVPADNVDKTSFVAKFTANAFFAVEFDFMVSINHLKIPFLKNYLFLRCKGKARFQLNLQNELRFR